MANPNICLASTIHDPPGKLYPFVKLLWPELRKLYTTTALVITAESSPDLINELAADIINIEPARGGAFSRRQVLEMSLGLDGDAVHYCDFDRILFWYASRYDELARITRGANYHKMIVLGRTGAAFSTHPFAQRTTEQLINLAFTAKTGYRMDLLSGSRVIPKTTIEKIIRYSASGNMAGIDVEWPFIIGLDNLSYIEVDGLAYEHKWLGTEKPVGLEIKTRFANLRGALDVIYRQKDFLPIRAGQGVHQPDS